MSFCANPAAVVSFNVAGNRFITSKDTVLREPASRLALLARGVLPISMDETGAIFLDRDARYFQLVLNYLRDGWCQVPKTAEERRELLQEVRYYQLAGMEAWMRTQDIMSEGAMRRQPLSSPAGSMPTQSAATLMSSQNFTPACVSPRPSMPGSSPVRSSFLNGPNQDLLAAGALAGFQTATIGVTAFSVPASPEPTHVSMIGSQLLNPATPQRPASASPYMGSRPSSAGPTLYSSGLPPQESLARKASLGPTDNMTQCTGDRCSAGGCYPFTGARSSVAASVAANTPRPSAAIMASQDSNNLRWTSRYLQSNAKLQAVANTLLELCSLAPHSSLHAGKASISISSECDHDKMGSLLGTHGLDQGRFRYQVVSVKSGMGWGFELALRPSTDLAVYDKYNIAEYLQVSSSPVAVALHSLECITCMGQ
eukprot:GHRR01021668.1.p1 GENE.GHRR01021668.1~~GHRR01021668.1.p1  ORF type:complete len:426 (+),score=90.43 GHRR01021668.1:69-1346(+)